MAFFISSPDDANSEIGKGESMDDEKSEEVIDGEKPDKADDKNVLDDLSDADGVVIEDKIEDDKKTTTIDEEKKEAKKEEKKKEPDEPEVDKLRKDLDQLRRDKNDLKKALHEARQEKKKPKDEDEAVLSEAELLQIIKDNKDDPVVMLNAMKYMAQQTAKGAKKEAINSVEISQKKQQFDTILRERYKDFDDEDSPIRKSTEKAKEVMMIKDHPFADALGTAVTVFANLPSISKYWFEEGKKAATDDKVNAAREKQIKDGKLTPPGSKSTVAIDEGSGKLSESALETARQKFGWKPGSRQMKIYEQQILGKK